MKTETPISDLNEAVDASAMLVSGHLSGRNVKENDDISVLDLVIVLAEGELWPNFVNAAKRRGAQIVVLNARLSPRSGIGDGEIVRNAESVARPCPVCASYLELMR